MPPSVGSSDQQNNVKYDINHRIPLKKTSDGVEDPDEMNKMLDEMAEAIQGPKHAFDIFSLAELVQPPKENEKETDQKRRRSLFMSDQEILREANDIVKSVMNRTLTESTLKFALNIVKDGINFDSPPTPKNVVWAVLIYMDRRKIEWDCPVGGNKSCLQDTSDSNILLK